MRQTGGRWSHQVEQMLTRHRQAEVQKASVHALMNLQSGGKYRRLDLIAAGANLIFSAKSIQFGEHDAIAARAAWSCWCQLLHQNQTLESREGHLNPTYLFLVSISASVFR